jgi:hypothetical protein
MYAVSLTLLLAASPLAAQPSIATAADSTPAKVNASPLPTKAIPGSDESVAPLPGDRAANLVGGVWQCETISGSSGTKTYTEAQDGSIDLQIELHTGPRTFHISEAYHFDGARKLWHLDTQGGLYAGSAGPWTGYKWIFDGTANDGGERRPVRVIYFDLADQAFRRDFQDKRYGMWQTYSAETCRRPSS